MEAMKMSTGLGKMKQKDSGEPWAVGKGSVDQKMQQKVIKWGLSLEGVCYLFKQFKSNHIINQIEMNTAIEQHNSLSTIAQKPLLTLDELKLPSTVEDYTQLIMWMAENPSFFVFTLFPIQNSTNMKLSISTKFHSRAYFDLVITASNGIPLQQLVPLLITCLSLAIKMHQSRPVSEAITPQKLIQGVGINMKVSQLAQFQAFVIGTLKGKMRFRTPEDYLNQFMRVYPYHQRVLRKALPSVIDLALTDPRACQFSAESIFFGAVLAASKIVPINMTDLEFNTLLTLNSDWNDAQTVCQMIEEQTQVTDDEEPSS